jgi:glycosidase
MDRINFGSRDNARRPISWSDKPFAGFSTVEPWIPTYSRYQEINLEKDKASPKSIFKFYKDLLAFRKSNEVILHGGYKEITNDNQYCYIYERELNNKKYVIVCNFEKSNVITVDNCQKDAKLILSNYSTERKLNGEYRPYELACYQIDMPSSSVRLP